MTKEGYTSLFNEMMEDMPKLLADRARFFEPIVAVFAKVYSFTPLFPLFFILFCYIFIYNIYIF